MGGSKKAKSKIRTTVYAMAVQMGLARCLDELVEIRVGDKNLWSGSLTGNADVQFNKWWLFGGYKREGGILGTGYLRMGGVNQPIDSNLQNWLGGDVPAFRNIAAMTFNGYICANSPYPKAWKFRLRRTESGWDNEDVWYREKCTIWMADGKIKAMNPAHIMYELWTSSNFRGLRRERMDNAAWRTFAELMFNEGFGLCLKVNKQDTISAIMQQVLDHTGAAQYIDRKTGLVVVIGIRGNYNPKDLPLFSPDNGLLGIDEYVVDAIPQSINELIVYYKDPLERGNRKGVRQKNLGAIHASGGIIKTDSVDYLGIPTSELANRVARRDLNARSGYIRSFRARFDRRAARYTIPGGLLRISDPARGIVDMVLRIGKVDAGEFESGIITVDAALDAFAMPATVYTEEEPGGYVPPDPTPVPIDERLAFEVSYRDLATYLGANDLDLLEPDSGFVASVADKPSSLTLRYALYDRIKGVGNYTSQAAGVFCSNAELAANCSYLDNRIVLRNVKMLTGSLMNGLVQAGTAALLGSEIVRVDAYDVQTNTLKIGRGCVDCVPVSHLAGEKIWFYQNATAQDITEYSTGVKLDIKLVPETTAAPLQIDDAPIDMLTFNSRAARPYPPGCFQIDGFSYPEEIDGGGKHIFSWTHRNRLMQAEQMIDTTAGDIDPEAQTSYTIEIYRMDTAALVALQDNITQTSWTWQDNLGGYEGLLRVRLYAVRDGLNSWQAHDVQIYRKAPQIKALTWDSSEITWDSDLITFDQIEG